MNRKSRLNLLLMAALVLGLSATLTFAQSGPAGSQQFPVGLNTISYQGRVMVNGQPYDGLGYFMFAIVDSQGNYTWNSDIIVQGQGAAQLGAPQNPIPLPVNQGLFSVRLGATPDMNPIGAQAVADPDSALRVWFSPDGTNFTQLPDRLFSAAPWAIMADTLDGFDSSEFALWDHGHWGQTWSGGGTGLALNSSDGVGLHGRQGASANFPPIAGAGIWGDSADHPGVWGSSVDAAGVVGITSHETGVAGMANKDDGVGVQGVAPVTGTVGIATNSSGSTRGVYGESVSPVGAGVYGKAKAASGQNAGVVGESDSTSGAGVSGYADATSGSTYGVYGQVYSPDGIGVYGTGPGTAVSGFSSGTSGYIYGVRGQSASPDGAGVAGFNVATDGPAYGVLGRSDGWLGIGVYGLSDYQDPGGGWGVYGKAKGPGGIGVVGVADSESGATSFGVYGEAKSTEDGSAGVYGAATAQNGKTYGVHGETSSSTANASGVYGKAKSYSGATNGVFGETVSQSQSSAAVYGYASNASGQAVALWARSAGSGDIIRGYGGDYPDVEFKVDNDGNVYADGGYNTPAADFAEMLSAVQNVEPGDVLVIGPDGQLTRSIQAYQTSVAGVYSTRPGFVAGSADDGGSDGKIPLAVVGVVPVKVSAENGPIHPGDLLTPSNTPGHAMKATPVDIGGVSIYRPGTIIGKALESLEKGTGVIRVLITLH
ncbi:MAG: hypothetical protein GXP42_14330 [Chloroflexi bacterium]|nr:hypothetical protein [Chloroflexota bacterium]